MASEVKVHAHTSLTVGDMDEEEVCLFFDTRIDETSLRLVMKIQTPTLCSEKWSCIPRQRFRRVFGCHRLTIVAHLSNLIHWHSFNPIVMLVVMYINSSI